MWSPTAADLLPTTKGQGSTFTLPGAALAETRGGADADPRQQQHLQHMTARRRAVCRLPLAIVAVIIVFIASS